MLMCENNTGIVVETVFVMENVPHILKRIIKNEIIRCSNYMADIHNDGLIEQWNEEFDRVHGKLDNYYYNPEYENFIIEKMSQTAEQMTKSNVSRWLTDFKVNEDFYLTAKLKGNPKSFITFYMKEVN